MLASAGSSQTALLSRPEKSNGSTHQPLPPVKMASLDDARLADLAGTEPGAVLLELTGRLGGIYHGSPNQVTKSNSLLSVLERIPWIRVQDSEYSLFCRNIISLALVSPSCITSIYRFILTEACSQSSERCEDLLCSLVRHIPSSTAILLSNFEYNFPHYSRPVEQIVCYVQLLVEMISRLPILRSKLLELVVEKFLSIDVAIQMEATNLPDELDVVRGDDQEMAEASEEDDGDALIEAMDSDLLRRSSSPIALNMADMMSKLDSGLVLIFQYFSRIKESPKDLKASFDALMQIFERSILPTFRSRSTPFILFYVTSLSPNLTDVYLGFLMKRLYHVFDIPGDGKKKTVASSASLLTVVTASYIGSFVARAKFLPPKLVRLSFDMLLTWCLRFIGDLPNHLRSGIKALRSSNSVVSERVAVFYAVVQAVMYIFCFRHKLLMHDHEGSDLASVKANYKNFLLPLFQSSLNPLRWCMASVVEEFVRLADMHDLIDCHQFIEKSSRRSAPPVSSLASSQDVEKFDDESRFGPAADQTGSFLGDLDSYFPFDPLTLKACSAFITSELYNEWNDSIVSVSDAEMEEFSSTSEMSVDEDAGHNRELLLCNPAWQGLAIRK